MTAPAHPRYEIDVAACRASPAARPIKPVHVELLTRSIREIGLLQPISIRKVDGGFEVIAGLHRLEAFKALGRATIPAIVRDDDDLRAELALIDENLIRNDYSPAERASAIARRKAIYEALHPETKLGGAGRARPKQVRQFGEPIPEEAERFTEATAKAVGHSERTIQREAARGEAIGEAALAKVVRTSLDKGEELDALATLAQQSPDKCTALIERAAAGEKVSAKAEVKKVRRAEREAELGAKIAALPQQTFAVILADPEWKWTPWSDAGMDRGVENTYPTSELHEIAGRDVASIAADDCVLYLWARADMLPQALAVMAAWGFQYVAQMIWRKTRISTGYWSRYDHENVLIGKKGKPVAPAMGTQDRSVFDGEPRQPGVNSSKPERLAEMIERLWPNSPKIELNRRGPPRPGWAAWGNEAEAITSPAASIGEPDGLMPLIRSGEGEPASDPGFSAGSPMDGDKLDIPNFLRRDANNRAPFHQQTSAEMPKNCALAAAAENDRGSAAV